MMSDFVRATLGSPPIGETRVSFPKSSVALHAMVANAGYDHVHGTGYDWHGMRRGVAPFVLVQHTLSGQGRLRWERQQFKVRAGQTMLLRFPHDHRYWLPEGGDWEFFWICLNGREVIRIWREVMARHGPLVQLPTESVERLAACCRAVLDGRTASAQRASSLAYTATMELAEALTPREPGSDRPSPVGRAISQCHVRLADPTLDVDQLAAAARLTKSHFSRVFATNLGVSPARYLLRLRMEEALRMLRMGESSVKLVAQSCGFSDSSYFSKVFRKFYNMRPSDVARSAR